MNKPLVSLKEAKELGLTRYFTGKPCKLGHISERGKSNRSCIDCLNISVKKWAKSNRPQLANYAMARRAKNIEAHRLNANTWKSENPDKLAQYKINQKSNKQKRLEAKAGRPRPDRCEVCKREATGRGAIHWDHCHKTGKFRGWLCQKCNNVLGLVDDNPEILASLIAYLQCARPQVSVSRNEDTAAQFIQSPAHSKHSQQV